MITISKEDYLKAIAEAEAEGQTVIPATLAHWLSVTRPAVTFALKRRTATTTVLTRSFLREAGAGHYGLPGMHERAKLVGGKPAVWSELDSGTETELTIPASIAYAKATVTRPVDLSRIGS